MLKLAVVYFPKINLDNVDNYRRKYDPNWHIIPPHLTIVTPVSDISENQLVEHIKTIAKDVKSFSIYLSGLKKSAFGDYLFLQVKEGTEEIVNLHKKLYSGILTPYKQTDIPFSPHITLGFFRTKDDKFDAKLFDIAYREAQDYSFDIFCDFDALSVIKGDGVSPAKIVKTINLQS